MRGYKTLGTDVDDDELYVAHVLQSGGRDVYNRGLGHGEGVGVGEMDNRSITKRKNSTIAYS